MEKKHNLGQYFTTNYSYILQNMSIPSDVCNIIEPFTGNGDLLKFIDDKSQYTIECYDIESRHDYIIQRDTIKLPPVYENKFVITNPPYLARNKSQDKILFDKYDVNDLYKCFIKELLTNMCMGGIIIVPLNFWSSCRKADINLRRVFLEKYEIIHINIFEEQVFDDTTTTVCAFQFRLNINEDVHRITPSVKKNESDALLGVNLLCKTSLIFSKDATRPKNHFGRCNITIYPENIQITTILNEDNNYMIGGHIYNLQNKNNYKLVRLTSKSVVDQDEYITNILVKCIDDNKDSKIGLSIVDDKDIYIDNTPNQSARTYMGLLIIPAINIETQHIVVEKFNHFLEENRRKYHSLFLTNYRESKDIARKRISFELVFQILEHILDEL